MKFKKAVAVTAVVGAAIAGTFAAGAAFAEPVSNSYVLVGSDTLQDAGNALANGTTVTGSPVRVRAAGATIGSFDAFGSPAIQTKSGGAYFARPSGSGAGVNALRASITGNPYSLLPTNTTPAATIAGQVDIARSSSGPGANANVDGKLAYVPFGRDAVAYVYKGGNAAWDNITAAQLKQIYEGTLTSIGGVNITPRIPQNGSGTRSFFLGAIGNPTLTPALADVNNKTAENDGSVLGNNEIIPFSVASWTAQAAGAAGTNSTAGVTLGSPTGVAPVTGSGSTTVPNAAYYSNTTFGRDTYLVVERARITPSDAKYDAVLTALVNPTNTSGLTNFTSPAASAPASVKKKFGFLAPSTTTVQYAYLTL